MNTLQSKLFFDVSIPIWGFIFGSVFGVISFIIVVLVEAAVMKRFFFDLSYKRCSIYSLLANLLSSILGFPIAYLFSNTTEQTFTTFQDFIGGLFLLFSTSFLFTPIMIFYTLGWWLILAFVITLISEFLYYKLLLKPKLILELVKFTVISNLASYAITIVLAFVAPQFIMFFTNK